MLTRTQWFLLAAVTLALWIVLGFVVAVPAGWPHLLLAAGVGAIIAAIAEDGRAAGRHDGTKR